MENSRVVRIGIEALLRNRSSVVAGWINALVAFSTRLFPRQAIAGLAAWAMREPKNWASRLVLV